MQMQADFLGTRVERPHNVESTALGAAMLAGLHAGIWKNVDELSQMREVDREFTPTITNKDRRDRLKAWRKAVKRAQRWEVQ